MSQRVVPGSVSRNLRKADFGGSSKEIDLSDRPIEAALAEANIVSSEARNSLQLHYPVLDLDFPATLLPSTTPGHFHLYLDRLVTQKKYFALLEALRDAGLLEEGYVSAALTRGYTAVRLPWIKKGDPK